ncbi:MAG: glycine cleavage system protein GcvH [Acidimicrobiales bacterium]
MNVPEELRYTPGHEWVRAGEGEVRVGITDFAQDALGDVVYVSLPTVGDTVARGDTVGEIESTKSVSEVYAPVSGEIVAVNGDLADAPQHLNEDPYGDGWFCAIAPSAPEELESLLSAEKYRELTTT